MVSLKSLIPEIKLQPNLKTKNIDDLVEYLNKNKIEFLKTIFNSSKTQNYFWSRDLTLNEFLDSFKDNSFENWGSNRASIEEYNEGIFNISYEPSNDKDDDPEIITFRGIKLYLRF